MKVEGLKWDSDFFNYKVGRLILTEDAACSEVEQALNTASQDVIYVMLPAKLNGRFAGSLDAVGAELMDRKQTYQKDLKPVLHQVNERIKLLEATEFTEKLESLAWQSGKYSRFYLDKKFKPRFRDMYSTWLKKSLSGVMADKVIVALDSFDRMLGFVTLKKDDLTGVIGLIAVDEIARGKGVGKLLVTEADKIYLNWGLEKASVITQGTNLAACSLYEKMGYSLEEEQYIYHYWKK